MENSKIECDLKIQEKPQPRSPYQVIKKEEVEDGRNVVKRPGTDTARGRKTEGKIKRNWGRKSTTTAG